MGLDYEAVGLGNTPLSIIQKEKCMIPHADSPPMLHFAVIVERGEDGKVRLRIRRAGTRCMLEPTNTVGSGRSLPWDILDPLSSESNVLGSRARLD
ncbi:hypothetical protein IAQ61_011657 [Plenodomus lingam]|uniref:Predicted protein n=1 Tax=Leptosphaeria maculans (strain JN3 / isolate v23.1.3 / race Av1-4-5-6-7-8) TaxID=985895 RepID=E5AAR2_LEPMJ|nr:predicted protein [Plenodomus lingam JN3]KAH9859875.1 hypothetical protein IAQ61_011657 [Plenodomus lingam]CBY00753.1 predicted protein [Plenodomus lingam JN3]